MIDLNFGFVASSAGMMLLTMGLPFRLVRLPPLPLFEQCSRVQVHDAENYHYYSDGWVSIDFSAYVKGSQGEKMTDLTQTDLHVLRRSGSRGFASFRRHSLYQFSIADG